MEKRYIFLISSLQTMMAFLLAHTAICCFVCSYYSDSGYACLVMSIVIVPAFLFSAIRIHVNNFVLYISLHVIITVIFSFLINIFLPLMIAGIISISLLAIYSIHSRITKPEEIKRCPPLASAVVFLIMGALGGWLGCIFFPRLVFAEALFFIIFYIIRYGIYQTEIFLRISKDTSNLPDKTIRRRIILLCTGFSSLLTVFSLGIGVNWINSFMGVLGGWLKNFMSFLISLLPLGNEIKPKKPSGSAGIDLSQLGGIKVKDTSAFGEILDVIVSVSVWIFLIIAILHTIYTVVYNFYKHFSESKTKDGEIREFAPPETEKKALTAHLPNPLRLINVTPEQKIRKYYRQYINFFRQKGTVISTSYTPLEISNTLNISLRGTDIAIRVLYEKARYSASLCTSEDVRTMKQLVRSSQSASDKL